MSAPASRAPPTSPPTADTALAQLRGVGHELAGRLREMGLEQLKDLWFHLPLRYEDLTRVSAIATLLPGEKAQVEGVVAAVERGFRFRPQLKVAITGDDGATLSLRFFHFR